MNPSGKILVVEAVIPRGNEPHPFKWLDLTMFMIGGKERTKDQFSYVFEKSGHKLSRIIPNACNKFNRGGCEFIIVLIFNYL